MLNDSIELAIAAIRAAETGPMLAHETHERARAGAKRLSASAFITHPHEESAAGQSIEEVLARRGWKTARDLKTIACIDNPSGPITDPLKCQSFVFAILGRASEASRLQAERIEAAKRLGKPIVPVAVADWDAMPKSADRLAGYTGVSFVGKDAAAQNALIASLAGAIEKEVLMTSGASARS